MKTFDKIFYGVCIVLSGCVLFLLLNLWFFKFPGIYIDTYTLLLFFALLGISLLPFVEKVKIGNLLEVERLKEKIKEVKFVQHLGEIIKSPKGDLFYYDADGKHSLPNMQTVVFLRTNKGEISVSSEEFDGMPTSYPVDDFVTAKKVAWGPHIFVILNGKKFYVSSMSHLADCGQKGPFYQISDDEIKLIPTGR